MLNPLPEGENQNELGAKIKGKITRTGKITVALSLYC